MYYWTENASGGSLETHSKDCPLYVSLAVDAQGASHLACMGDARTWYAHRSNGTWTWDDVDIFPTDMDFAISPDGEPHILQTPGGLGLDLLSPKQPRYWSKVDGEWSFEVVDQTTTQVYRGHALAIDTEGQPHLSYIRARTTNSISDPTPAGSVWYATPAAAAAADVARGVIGE